MKTKQVIFIILLFFVGLVFWYYKYINGWMVFRKNTDTPEEYLNNTTSSRNFYLKDSAEIINRLRELLLKHEDFFHSTAYYDSTELVIDTIIYSPNFKKLAFIVITKNPTNRQLMPDKRYSWYYDATCYLGIRQRDVLSLNWMGPIFTNSYSQQEISNNIREACFKTFITDDSLYRYNLNDIRFWDSPIWKKNFGNKLIE